uniref:PH domain-containing protein n=1 Tax=Poecilia reticulata TaxID=8081 RepID=A0A3P9PBN6_POERE
MMKLDEDDEWKKHWFVLSTASLRFYRDASAEEASDLDGEIDLSKCYSVSEHQVQRNYGFQIHTQKAVFTLSAMTAGIRRNWIQALMKNVNPADPADPPDVASLPGRRLTCSPAEVGPDVTQDSAPKPPGPASSSDSDQSGVGAKAQLDGSCLGDRAASCLELGDLERRRRRQERRRRYESLLGFSLGRGSPPRSQLEMEERIAECWRRVERTALRPERTVALPTESRDALETETLLQGCRTLIDRLKAELGRCYNEPLRRNQELETQLDRRNQELETQLDRRNQELETQVIEELQQQHQQEVERLLVERDRLLEEESAATATAIEAIEKAHRAELQREIQRRSQSENCNGNSQLEEIHREELASCRRELDVLSQQFSLKCLENGHLVRGAEAERKALGQCQQENRALRSRNQELSRHLAAEISRLCAANQPDLLPVQITLRVQQAEVQSLKQEVASLKDELQAAVKDKRNAAKKYQDVQTELSFSRARAEREAEELRENLRLAHRALEEASKVKQMAAGCKRPEGTS